MVVLLPDILKFPDAVRSLGNVLDAPGMNSVDFRVPAKSQAFRGEDLEKDASVATPVIVGNLPSPVNGER